MLSICACSHSHKYNFLDKAISGVCNLLLYRWQRENHKEYPSNLILYTYSSNAREIKCP